MHHVFVPCYDLILFVELILELVGLFHKIFQNLIQGSYSHILLSTWFLKIELLPFSIWETIVFWWFEAGAWVKTIWVRLRQKWLLILHSVTTCNRMRHQLCSIKTRQTGRYGLLKWMVGWHGLCYGRTNLSILISFNDLSHCRIPNLLRHLKLLLLPTIVLRGRRIANTFHFHWVAWTGYWHWQLILDENAIITIADIVVVVLTATSCILKLLVSNLIILLIFHLHEHVSHVFDVAYGL